MMHLMSKPNFWYQIFEHGNKFHFRKYFRRYSKKYSSNATQLTYLIKTCIFLILLYLCFAIFWLQLSTQNYFWIKDTKLLGNNLNYFVFIVVDFEFWFLSIFWWDFIWDFFRVIFSYWPGPYPQPLLVAGPVK